VATTPKAKGVFPEGHPLALGIYGLGGHPSASTYLDAGVDVLFAVGTGFGEVSTNTWTDKIKASRAFIQIDVDAGQIGRNYRADIGFVGPAEVLLRQLLERVPKSRRRPAAGGLKRLGNPGLDEALGGPIKPQRALWELQTLLPEDTIYAVDIGDHMVFALHYLQIDRPDCFYFASGLGSMGSGLGAALGVKLGVPDRTVVCICGDGTISMCGTELLTAAQQGLPLICAVFDDGRYGMVDNGFQSIYGRSHGFPLAPLDVRGFAERLGAQAAAIDRPGQLEKIDFAGIAASGRPLVLDIRVDRTEKIPFQDRIAH
jgi:acetolactate synthase-1/2/3 large subunit